MLPRALVALLLLAALVPPASGQAPAAGLQVLQDPAGDVGSAAAGTPGPPATALYPGADLLGLKVTESTPSFTFALQLAALPDPKDAGADGVVYVVQFAHNGREFQLEVVTVMPGAQAVTSQPPFATLSYRDSSEAAWSFLWWSQTAPTFDPNAKSVSVEVPRLDLLDAQGASPYPGRSLEAVRVRSHATLEGASIGLGVQSVSSPQHVGDEMPDDPAQAGTVPVFIGPRQTGHARLTSQQPFRASNGEATTILYQVMGHNDGDAADRFELSAPSVPHGYSLTLPVPVVEIPGRSSVEIPVLLTMPFGHQHGDSAAVLLEMRSASDPGSVGRMEVGVRYLDIPQPAGHHDTVYLHKARNIGGIGPAFGFRTGYINTLEDDPSDAKENYAESSLYIEGGGRMGAHFRFPLSPALSMGLDVDPADVGHLRVPVGSTGPMSGVTVSATLFVSQGVDYPSSDAIILATMEESEPFDLMPKGQAIVEGDLVPDPEAGRVPYARGQDLWLEVVVTGTGHTFSATDEGVYIAPGGSARLPLREWHDPVDDVLAALDGPGLSPLGAQERLVNPGKAVVFPVSIANPLDRPVEVEFEVTGPNAEWAATSVASVTAPAHGVAQASVVVRVPSGARDGDRADLVLQAYAADDPTARGLLRLVAEVDTDAQHPDDTALASTEAKESPGPAAPLALAALAALALLRRRRGGAGGR